MQRTRPTGRNLQVTRPIAIRRIHDQKPYKVAVAYPIPRRSPNAPPLTNPVERALGQRKARINRTRRWLLILGALAVFMASMCSALTLAIGLVYAGGILPGVSVAGIAVGGLQPDEAADKLRAEWNTIKFIDGSREWTVDSAQLGITLDAQRTADLAYRQGRGEGNLVKALFAGQNVTPVISLDFGLAESAFTEFASQVQVAPVNAGVQFGNGHVEATPPQNGRMLDVAGTLAKLNTAELADGTLELAMLTVQPEIFDASPMLAEAERLLSSFLDIRVYDPLTGDSVYWSLPPEQWASWLAATPDPNSATGLALSVNPDLVRGYLDSQAALTFDPSRYLKVEDGVAAVQQAIAHGQTTAYVRVYHHDRQHVVGSGETIISIAWDYGVPYPWIQAANPGVEYLSAGQTITIPSPDNFMPYPVVPDKRIVVNISQQRTWVYENGNLKWEWATSTGISSSPTWPGVYQIISHEPNAYAANWDLWMPDFMGVYNPIPGTDFTNGFHGFPTRGGGQLLWENSLGSRVTYGCILLSNTNVQQLYDWAQEGVVVEIQP